MTARVLRLYHSAVVDEYREREAHLLRDHGYDIHLVTPPVWVEGGSLVSAGREDRFPLHVLPIRGRRHPILFWYAPKPLRRLLRQLKPAIVDIHEEPYSLAVASTLRAVKAEVPDAAVCVYTA